MDGKNLKTKDSFLGIKLQSRAQLSKMPFSQKTSKTPLIKIVKSNECSF